MLPRPTLTDAKSKTAFGVGLTVVAATLAAALFRVCPVRGSSPQRPAPALVGLPATWKISVDVLNGGGDINYTRRIADRIGSKAYRIERVSRADRFDYPETAVYFHTGGERIAERLAEELQGREAATRPREPEASRRRCRPGASLELEP